MSDDSTRILDEGTQDYPLDPAAAAAAEPCPHCQTSIPAGEQFCPACGYQRGTWQDGAEAAAPAAAVEARYFLVAADGARYPLPEGETVAGRGEVALRISDGFVSRSHARFTVTETSVTVTDLGSANGTFVAGERLEANEPAELTVGTAFKLGQTEFTLEEAAPEPETEAEPATAEPAAAPAEPEDAAEAEPADTEDQKPELLAEAHLDVKPAASPWSLARTGTDEVLYLPFGETQLGRKPDKCDLVVRGDSYISGRHCRLVASLEHLEVTDLGSTNGTHANGERVAPDQTVGLSAGDTLRIGSTDFTVVCEAAAVAEEQSAPDTPPEPAEPVEPEG